jgi:mono/diheme cytochrome c family protein
MALLTACHQKPAAVASNYLNDDNLPAQQFRVDIKKDTILYTAQGIKITLDAGSISADNNWVTLEIKEALNIGEMLKAGLTTQSENGLLSSDGMFFISTKESSVIKKAINISLPATYADGNMKLYKGVATDQKLIWRNPRTMDKPSTTFTDLGKKLFESNCAQCHNPLHLVTGPPLAWIDKRKNRKWLYDFVHNNAKVLASGDQYACCIFNSYGKTAMNIFQGLDSAKLDAIFAYVDKEAKQKGIPENFNPNPVCDSCFFYRKYFAELTRARDSLVKNNDSMVKTKVIEPPDADPNADNGGLPGKVNPENFKTDYYQFKVDAYGWYNIDDLLKGRFGSVECNVKVKLDNNLSQRVNVFLVLPAYKVFNEGGLLDDGTQYGFYTVDGRIYLPQAATAFVFALGEEDGKMFFGSTQFTTAASQTITLRLDESTKASMMNFFETIGAKDIYLNVEKTKNFDGLQKVDQEIKRIQSIAVKCDCDGKGDTLIVR